MSNLKDKLLATMVGIDKESLEKRIKAIKAGKHNAKLALPIAASNPLIDENSPYRKVVTYPFMLPSFDQILDIDSNNKMRGCPGGSIVHFCGNNNTFKTSIIDRMAINCLNDGGFVYRINLTANWSAKYFASGELGKIKKKNRFLVTRANTFKQMFEFVSSVLQKHTDFLLAVAKDNGVDETNLYYAKDIAKIMIIVDDFGSMFSETSLGNEFNETKVAEENSDIHRFFKIIQPQLQYLGATIVLGNNFRANINTGGGGYGGPKRKPYAWESIEYYVNIAFDLSRMKQEQTEDKVKYHNIEKIMPRIRKLKGKGYATRNLPPVYFYRGLGFDVLRNCLDVLQECGFYSGRGDSGTNKFVEFYESNKNDVPIPDSLSQFAGKKLPAIGFLKELEKPKFQAKFILAYYDAAPLMDVEWISDKRLGRFADDVLADMESVRAKVSGDTEETEIEDVEEIEDNEVEDEEKEKYRKMMEESDDDDEFKDHNPLEDDNEEDEE